MLRMTLNIRGFCRLPKQLALRKPKMIREVMDQNPGAHWSYKYYSTDKHAQVAQTASSNDSFKKPKIYRHYKDGYIVRQMLPADVQIVEKWLCKMGTAPAYDVRVALDTFSKGLYVGELDGEVIATSNRLPWSENIFYGSVFMVDEKYQGAGYGTRVRDEVAREYVGQNILCVDALKGKLSKRNKVQFGYKSVFDTVYYEGYPQFKDEVGIGECQIVKFNERDFNNLMMYDNKCFIVPDSAMRRRFLQKWLCIEDSQVHLALDSTGKIVGYGRLAPCIQQNHNIIAPLYADSFFIASAIFQQLANTVAGEKVGLSIWQSNLQAVLMVQEFGLKETLRFERMHLNGDAKEYKDCVFGVTSTLVCGF